MRIPSLTLVAVLAGLGGCNPDLEPDWLLDRWPGPTSPAISDHGSALFVSVGPDGAEAVCVALGNGGLGWHTPLAVSPGAVAVTISGGQTLVATGTTVTSLDDQGAILNAVEFGSPVVEAPAVAADGSMVVATEDRLVIGDREVDLPDAPVHQPILRQDDSIVVEGASSLFAISAAGDLLWSTALVVAVGSPPVADADGNVYVAREGMVAAFDADGRPRWTHAAVAGSPAVGDDLVVIVTGEGLTGLDGNGQDLWTIDGECGSAAIGKDGHVFAGCTLSSGRNSVVEIDDGKVVNRAGDYAAGGFLGPPALSSDGTLVIAWGQESGFIAGLTGSPGPDRAGGRGGIDERNSGRVH